MGGKFSSEIFFEYTRNSLLTITETLSEVRKSLETQDKKIMDNLKKIESNLDSKMVTFSKELEKVLNRD